MHGVDREVHTDSRPGGRRYIFCDVFVKKL
jgi:hypothetical protein